MLGVAIAVALIGFILKAGAALGSGWWLVPIAAVACICHVVVHARGAGAGEPPIRLAILSSIFLAIALLFQMEYTPGYNCAEDTLASLAWKLGWASEEACDMFAGTALIVDLLLYIPVIVTWILLGTRAASQRA